MIWKGRSEKKDDKNKPKKKKKVKKGADKMIKTATQ
jgi:hypothetical protein